MTKAFDKISAGLREADAYLRGGIANSVVHHIEVPIPDVSAIRAKTSLSQQQFARSIGVAIGTLQGWEQGRRTPDGPARVLLALIERRPAIVQEELLGR